MFNVDLDDRPFYSSVVTEHVVPQARSIAFHQWHAQVVRSARLYNGYIRTDLCPPLKCIDGVTKWFSITHFDSPNHLNAWLTSGDREQLYNRGQRIYQTYKFKSFTTGLEGWFSPRSQTEQVGLGPPAWKQVAAVVLGLYPTVMLQARLFTAIDWLQPGSVLGLPAIAMLINNIVTSCLLTWVVMPWLSRRLDFWLRPAYRLSLWRTDLIGLAIVGVALGLMCFCAHSF